VYSLNQGRVQKWADIAISVAYFSIPLELLYFGYRFKELPLRRTLVQFVLFILLCGCTHLLAANELLLKRTQAMLTCATVVKSATAIVSLMTALFLVWEIPRFLKLAKRGQYLKVKADELDEEVGELRKKEAASHSVRMLAAGIYCSLDTMTILETTIVELSKVLRLTDCAVWSTTTKNPHVLHVVCAVGTLKGSREVIPIDLEEIQTTIASTSPVPLDPRTCLLGTALTHGAYAVSLVLPHLTFTGEVQPPQRQFILALAKDDSWSDVDWEILEIANSQISVAISHAYILQDLQAQNRELKDARAAAELGIKAREDFLAVVSHEMRTPLHAVLAISSVLQQSKTLVGEDLEMVDTIYTSSGLLAVLIDDVLDASRINRGDFRLREGPFDLINLVKEASRMIEPMARESGYTFVVDTAHLPQFARGDSKRIMQMWLNLLNNALKFTRSSLVFKVWEEDKPKNDAYHTIRVDVIDDGIGIEAASIGTLCERFQQLDSGRKAGGMGLGLSICKHLSGLMNGSVWLSSSGQGFGTTASLRIQLQRVGVDAARTILKRSESVASLKNMRVLIVDDNSVNRLVTARMLQKLGCCPKSAESGEACLRLLQSELTPYAIILLDISMPNMDGFETFERVKALPESKRPRTVVALTADQRPETLERCLKTGMAGLLTKPANLDSLRDTLLAHLF
jgi:ethylene receptor